MSDNKELTNVTPASLRRQSGLPRSRENSGDAEQLYADMKASVQSPRKKKNIDNVWKALRHLSEMKSTDVSIASVARAIEALGLTGPKAQSIRNTEGKDFRDLIRAYENEHAVAGNRTSESSEDERIVGSIADFKTKAIVRELLNESRSKDRRINMLKNIIGKSPPFDIESKLSPEPSVPKVEAVSSKMNWTSIETAAVVSFLINIRDSGEDLNLRFDPASGALLWKDGILEVARPGFLGVLIKIAGEEK